MEEQERTEEETAEADVESHRRKSLRATDEPTQADEETDDVEAHQLRARPTNY